MPGDDPIDIASGPTVADPTTCADALDVVRRYGIELPPTVRARPRIAARGETVKPGDPRLARAEVADDRHAAAWRSKRPPRVAQRGGRGAGDPRRRASKAKRATSARCMAGIARQVAHARPAVRRRPACCSRAARRRSPCAATGAAAATSSSCSSLAVALDGEPGIFALAGDTDGVDGQEEIAGAIVAPDTLARAWRAGHPARATASPTTTATASSSALGDSVVTGPTLTNVNDFRAILVTLDPAAR